MKLKFIQLLNISIVGCLNVAFAILKEQQILPPHIVLGEGHNMVGVFDCNMNIFNIKIKNLLKIVFLCCLVMSCSQEEVSLDELKQNVQQAIEKQDYKTAIIHYRNLILLEDSVENRFQLADLYFMEHELSAAYSELVKVKNYEVDPDTWLLPFGVTAVLSGKWQVISALSPDDFDNKKHKSMVLSFKAWSSLLNNNNKEAESFIEQAYGFDIDNQVLKTVEAMLALNSGQMQAAENLLMPIESKYLDNEKYLLLAAASLGKNDTQKAIDHLIEGFNKNPTDPRILIKLVNLVISTSNKKSVDKYLAELKQRYPDTLYEHLLNGKWLFIQRDFKKAQNILQKAYALDNSNPEVNMYLGLVSAEIYQWEAAINYFKKSLAKHPGHLQSLLALSNAYLFGVKDAGSALENLLPYTKTYEGVLAFELLLIDAMIQNDRLNEALRRINRVQKKFPDLKDLNVSKALVHIHSNKHESAVDALSHFSDSSAIASRIVLARIYLNKKQFSESEKILLELEKTEPDNLLIKELKGQYYFLQNKYDNAKKEWESILKIQPKFKNAWLRIADIGIHLKDEVALSDLIEKMTSHFGEDVDTLLVKWELARLQKDNDKILAIAEKIWSQDTSHLMIGRALAQYYSEVDPRKVESVILKMGKAHPENALVQYNLGRFFVREKDYAKSIEPFKRAIASNEAGLPYYLALINSYRQLNMTSQISRIFEQIKSQFAKDPVFERQYVQHLARNKYFKKATVIATKAKPEIHRLFLEADIAAIKQEYKAAIEKIKLARGISDSRHLVSWQSKMHQADNDKAAAVSLLKSALKKYSGDKALLVELSNLLLSQGNYAEAAQGYETLLKDSPKNAPLLNNLTSIYSELSDKRALKYAHELRKINIDKVEFIDSIAWAEIKFGNKKQGIAELERLIVRGKSIPEVEYHLAMGYLDVGNKDKAIPLLEKLANKPSLNIAKKAQEALSNIK